MFEPAWQHSRVFHRDNPVWLVRGSTVPAGSLLSVRDVRQHIARVEGAQPDAARSAATALQAAWRAKMACARARLERRAQLVHRVRRLSLRLRGHGGGKEKMERLSSVEERRDPAATGVPRGEVRACGIAPSHTSFPRLHRVRPFPQSH